MSTLEKPPATPVPTLLAIPEGDAIRCGTCAHRCLVREGRHGICGVRSVRGGTLWCDAYGAVAAIGIDPIEKKPLFHVDPGTLTYSIATPGCPFHCQFCQNWELALAPRLGLRRELRAMPPSAVVEAALRAGATSIAYTYVEPTVFLEYALDTARLARAAGLRNLFVTDGYATPEAIEQLAPVLDAANVDLKSFDDAFYRHRCGARLQPVLEAVEAYRRAGVWLELTTLVIPGLNDSDAELRALTGWIVARLGPDVPWHVSRFHPAYRMTDVPQTPLPTLLRAAEIGREAGIRYVYVGNAPDLWREATECPRCGLMVVERHGYDARSRLGPGGTCPGCGEILAGRWERRGP
jgi:pyruvate formate lyase activating enzyme